MAFLAKLHRKLEIRRSNGMLLPYGLSVEANIFNPEVIDFISCDYISISRDLKFRDIYMNALQKWCDESDINPMGFNLSKNALSIGVQYPNDILYRIESMIEKFYCVNENGDDRAFLFKSGSEANLGFFGSVAEYNDYIVLDEYCHMTIKEGSKLSKINKNNVLLFKHNNIESLNGILAKISSSVHGSKRKGSDNNDDNDDEDSGVNVIIGVDSIYSMDGDIAPVLEILKLCDKYSGTLMHCGLFIDEAHTSAVYGKDGKGLICELFNNGNNGSLDYLKKYVIGRLMSLSKAIGASGSVIIGNKILHEYLSQYANSHIFTHCLAPAHAVAIECIYNNLFIKNECEVAEKRHYLNNILVPFYLKMQKKMIKNPKYHSKSNTFIQYIKMDDDKLCEIVGHNMCKNYKLAIAPLHTPVVPRNEARIRILLHAHNTKQEIIKLFNAFNTELEKYERTFKTQPRRSKL